MAKTTQELFDDYLEEKEGMPDLNALQSDVENGQEFLAKVESGSKVSQWMTWIWLKATADTLLYKAFEHLVKEIKALFAADKPHTRQWYVKKVKEFQYGYDLVINDNDVAVYEEDVPDWLYDFEEEIEGEMVPVKFRDWGKSESQDQPQHL